MTKRRKEEEKTREETNVQGEGGQIKPQLQKIETTTKENGSNICRNTIYNIPKSEVVINKKECVVNKKEENKSKKIKDEKNESNRFNGINLLEETLYNVINKSENNINSQIKNTTKENKINIIDIKEQKKQVNKNIINKFIKILFFISILVLILKFKLQKNYIIHFNEIVDRINTIDKYKSSYIYIYIYIYK